MLNIVNIGDRVAAYGENEDDKNVIYYGTVRFQGHLDGKDGAYIGVEWDNNFRGKHRGQFQGKQYFRCGAGHTGSFFKLPAAALPRKLVQRSFLSCVLERYASDLLETSSLDGNASGEGREAHKASAAASPEDCVVVAGGSPKTVRAALEALRSVSLSRCAISSCVIDTDRRTLATHGLSVGDRRVAPLLPLVQTVDLSDNLLSSWTQLAAICDCMPNLRTLILSNNPLSQSAESSGPSERLPPQSDQQSSASLHTVVFNGCFAPNRSPQNDDDCTAAASIQSENSLMAQLVRCFPAAVLRCKELHLAFNGLTNHRLFGFSTKSINESIVLMNIADQLHGSSSSSSSINSSISLRTIVCLNLDGNELRDWSALAGSLQRWCPALEKLQVNDNQFDALPVPVASSTGPSSSSNASGQTGFNCLRALSLGGNPLHRWTQLDGLWHLAEQLTELRMLDCPVLLNGVIVPDQSGGVENTNDALEASRCVFIALLPALRLLNRSEISADDRKDAERFFVEAVRCRRVPDLLDSAVARERFERLAVDQGLSADLLSEQEAADRSPTGFGLGQTAGAQRLTDHLLHIALELRSPLFGDDGEQRPEPPVVETLEVPSSFTIGQLRALALAKLDSRAATGAPCQPKRRGRRRAKQAGVQLVYVAADGRSETLADPSLSLGFYGVTADGKIILE